MGMCFRLRPGSAKWWALAAVNLAVIAVSLDATVLSVALPTLAHSLHASESDLQWFTSGYLLALSAVMLPAGLLGDRYGRKRAMLVALSLFGAASAACAYAPSAGAFIAARVMLGVSGAAVIVMALSALTVLFNEAERARAVGIWAAANFLALPIGPILGGWLLSHYWWGWVFMINVPVAAVGVVAVAALVPESRASERSRIDLVGITGSVGGLLSLTYGVILAGEHGWSSSGALSLMSVGVALLAAFVFWEAWLGRREGGAPLVDPALLRSASFSWSVILQAIGVLAIVGVLFTMPQYFQGVLGSDAMGSGLRLLPLVGGLIAGALPADRLAGLVGSRRAVAIGFGLLAAGLLLGARTAANSSGIFIAGWMALTGAGMGIALATTATTALAELPKERAGVGSAVLQAFNKIGGPLGSAILGSALTSAYLAHLELTGLPSAAAAATRQSVFGGVAVAHQLHSPALLENVHAAFAHGLDQALYVSTGIALIGMVLALVFLPRARAAEVRPECRSTEQEEELERASR
jgi:DHA2 family multidrug resistance protein-like MFS transporter